MPEDFDDGWRHVRRRDERTSDALPGIEIVEDRTLLVPAENRLLSVANDNRVFGVPSEGRTRTIRAENRTLTIPLAA